VLVLCFYWDTIFNQSVRVISIGYFVEVLEYAKFDFILSVKYQDDLQNTIGNTLKKHKS